MVTKGILNIGIKNNHHKIDRTIYFNLKFIYFLLELILFIKQIK